MDDIDVIERARQFALKAHADQKYGEFPYEHHLQSVVDQLVIWGYDAETYYNMHAIAWLHDVVEDVEGVNLKEFDDFIAQSVWYLTDPPGDNRATRKAALNWCFLVANPHNRAANVAAVVKCADRVCNLKMSIQTDNKKKMQMYIDEHSEFMRCIASRLADAKIHESKKIFADLMNLYGSACRNTEAWHESIK